MSDPGVDDGVVDVAHNDEVRGGMDDVHRAVCRLPRGLHRRQRRAVTAGCQVDALQQRVEMALPVGDHDLVSCAGNSLDK